MYIAQVFRENNITITYSSEFERFPPESYIRNVLTKTREEGRSEILFDVQKLCYEIIIVIII